MSLICTCVATRVVRTAEDSCSDEFNCHRFTVDGPLVVTNSTLYLNQNASEAGKMTEKVLGLVSGLKP